MESTVLAEITETTRQLIACLDERERDIALRPITEDALRHRWTYVPSERSGLVLGDLDRSQRKAVHRMLAAVLSPHAYAQAAAIMAVEDVLDHQERGRRDRHSGDYWTVLFGEAGGTEPWGWRFEGHHISVNVTVVDGSVSATPFFFGANPARVSYREATISQPLRLEEELARELLDSMGTRGRRVAVVSGSAPPDVLTGDQPRVSRLLEPVGVSMSKLAPASREALKRLVRMYVDRLTPDMADAEFERLSIEDIYFAWAGSHERGSGHYYRIQGPKLLIEYDNTAHNANHVHSVWRRHAGDFGDDLLAAHYATSH